MPDWKISKRRPKTELDQEPAYTLCYSIRQSVYRKEMPKEDAEKLGQELEAKGVAVEYMISYFGREY